MLAETLIDFRGFMEDIALVNEVKMDRCCYNFVMQSTYASP